MKIESQAEIYQTLNEIDYEVDVKQHLTHLFRLTNTVMIIFPAFTQTVNTIGRYKSEEFPTMKEMFYNFSGEIVKVYEYIKYLTDQIFVNYREHSLNDLQCFIDYLPELELLCDRIEDLIVNKYLRGKKIKVKIDFKEEKIAELQYYLIESQKEN